MELVKIRSLAPGVLGVTLPKKVVTAAGVLEGSYVNVELNDKNQIVLTPITEVSSETTRA